MKIQILTLMLLSGLLLPITAQSQKLIKGIEFGAQTAVPHYFSWAQYGEEEIDLLRPYVQSAVTSYAGGFLEKRLNAVFSVRAGLLMHQITFSRQEFARFPNILNQIQVDTWLYRRTTQHRIGIPISLKAAIFPRLTLGMGVHVSRTFFSTAGGGVDRILVPRLRQIQLSPAFVYIPDFHLASFMTASYKLMDFSAKPLFLTVTGEYDHRWSMPTSNGINYRLIRLGLGVEWRFE